MAARVTRHVRHLSPHSDAPDVPSDQQLRRLAVATAILAGTGVVLTAFEIANLPEPKGDGLPTFFGAAFALLYLTSALAALVESGLLMASVSRWDAGAWSRGLFAAGAAAGGLAMLARAVGTVELTTSVRVAGPWITVWALLAVGGTILSGIGVLAYSLEPLNRRLGMSLGGGVLAVLALLIASITLEPVPRSLPALLLLLGLFSLCLGAVLHAATSLDSLLIRVPLAVLVLLGTIAAATLLFAGRAADAALVGFLSLATLWALAAALDARDLDPSSG